MTNTHLNKKVLIDRLSEEFNIHPEVSALMMKTILSTIINSLAKNERVEIRRFGSFNIRTLDKKIARNPKTDQNIQLPKQYLTHFKVCDPLRNRLNASQPR